jgi:hypothetical protein
VEAKRLSETSVYYKPTWHHIREYGILHSHRRENLKSYIGQKSLNFSSEEEAFAPLSEPTGTSSMN